MVTWNLVAGIGESRPPVEPLVPPQPAAWSPCSRLMFNAS